jgi:hypothetical protein
MKKEIPFPTAGIPVDEILMVENFRPPAECPKPTHLA